MADAQPICAPALPDGRPVNVLLIDDEMMIRELGQTWLQRLGYRVFLAANGKEGIDLFERERDKIDLVILDIVMPEISGRDVFRRIRQIDPHVPVLFSSGFSNEPIRPTEEDGVVGFIAKPYQVQDLARAVRNALDAAEKEQVEKG
jgi:CheY-like chemotaxis protein